MLVKFERMSTWSQKKFEVSPVWETPKNPTTFEIVLPFSFHVGIVTRNGGDFRVKFQLIISKPNFGQTQKIEWNCCDIFRRW